jgi:hypothetical protein
LHRRATNDSSGTLEQRSASSHISQSNTSDAKSYDSRMANNATSKVQIHTFIPLEVRDELHRLARENERSLAGEMRRAIVQHLAQGRDGSANEQQRAPAAATPKHHFAHTTGAEAQ